MSFSILWFFINQNILNPITTRFSSSTSALFILGGSFIVLCLLLFLLYRLFLPKLRKLKLFHKVLDIIKGFWQGIMTIKNVKHKFLFVFYSLLMWGFYTLTIYLCFHSISATKHLAFIDALTVMAIGSIGTLVPTPGGIGAYQYFVTLTLISLFLIEKNTQYIYLKHWI